MFVSSVLRASVLTALAFSSVAYGGSCPAGVAVTTTITQTVTGIDSSPTAASSSTTEAACTWENQRVRHEWSNLPPLQRKAYTDAVQCLMDKPSTLNNTEYPLAKSRYFDFLATHINYTLSIHLCGSFLTWHRNFVWLYENALRDECGYNGTQPYWDWPKYIGRLETSPLFSGDPYSLGSNGVKINESDISFGPNQTLPHGDGGGCVYKGPFVNHTSVHYAFDTSFIFTNNGTNPAGSFDYQPTCFSRDVNEWMAEHFTNQTIVDELLTADSIKDFQGILSADLGSLDLGAHPGGHFTMGNNGSDFWASPTDPAFYLHHAQVDRLYTLWQALNETRGRYTLNGTLTVQNIPPSRNLTLEDYEYWGNLGPSLQVQDLMNPVTGPFCYRYE